MYTAGSQSASGQPLLEGMRGEVELAEELGVAAL
eukprot:SAG31_NODE_45350_length_259_cov_0.650000_1_plen_33_part_01